MDYPSNSRKEQEERNESKTKYHKAEPGEKPEKNLEKVISGKAITKPKGIGYKFRTIFLGGDMKETVAYVNSDVLLPKLRDLMFALVWETAGQVIFGKNRRGRPPETRTDYRAYSRSPMRSDESRFTYGAIPDQQHRPQIARARRDTDNVILPTRDDVDFVLERMRDLIDQYEVASLADFHEIIGAEKSFVDEKWGWYRFNNIPVRQHRDGYIMILPPMEELDVD